MSGLILPRRIREGRTLAGPRNQRGFIINPYALGAAGGGGDPSWGNVVSLLHFNGTDTSTTFTDNSSSTWTANGNAQIDTAQSVFGGASGLFDGNGDYIISNTMAALAGSDQFTLEFRVRLNSLSGWQILAAQFSGNAMLFNYNHSAHSNKFQFAIGGLQLGSTVTPVANTWYAVAATRDAGGTVRLFVDGNLENSGTGTAGVGATPFYIGCIPPYGGGTIALNGWMDEFRFTKGVCRYTASYTPAVAEFPNS